jgi:hypothetical protein
MTVGIEQTTVPSLDSGLAATRAMTKIHVTHITPLRVALL